MQLFDYDTQHQVTFIPERRFSKECRIFKHPDTYKDVIDLFIFKNPNVL